MISIIGTGFEIMISIVHNLRELFVSTRARFKCLSKILHEKHLDFEHDFEALEGRTCLRDIHPMKEPVKVEKMFMTDMGLTMKAVKHLIVKEIKNYVHQKNYAARLVSIQTCKYL